MTARYDRGKCDIVEFLKKEAYKERSSSSGSQKTGNVIYRPMKLKSLPQVEWHKMDKVMADLKATLPDISPKEVRRFKIPFHQAILLELQEEQHEEAARYMKELLEIDDTMNEQQPGTVTWKKMYLKDQREFVLRLKDGLVASEKARRKGDYVARATSLLDTAVFFQSRTYEWWWVAEHLYQAALSAAEYIEGDNGYTITLIRYLYGRFLFRQLQNPREAVDYLNEAREAAKTKPWNASRKLGEKQASVFVESNTLLYQALLVLARRERPRNPDFALKACIEALERATDAEYNEYVIEALREVGKSYVAVKDIKRALHSFSKMLAIAKRMPDVEGVCNAHMELAFAYKQVDDNLYAEKHLRMLRENAEEFGLAEKLADAHYYTGEHHLSQGNLSLSTAHLESALCLYNRLGSSREADRARSIAGISKGQEVIEGYFSLIFRCGELDRDATLKLCEWKSRRASFWADRVRDDKSEVEMRYENSESTASSLKSFLND
ncbi:uncharacterized protein LOC143378782 [Andrena cerasifolii]|uniref:uncharacterized protein LOC143378782 n=1 Tax=Andrena cerasifolii TaxID=2819439 RepID=UPI0040380831